MNKYQAYLTYIALKNHFQEPGYDYFKYNGKVRVKPESLDKRRDAFQFDRLGHEYGSKEIFTGFLVANLLHNPKMWVGEFLTPKAKKTYDTWRGKIDALTYVFKKDMKGIKEFADSKNMKIMDLVRTKKGEVKPPILKMAMTGDIELETYVILDRLLGLTKYYDERMEFDPLYSDFSLKIKKYSPFIQVDNEEFAKIFKEFL